MKELVANHALNKEINNNILSIAASAQERKNTNPSTINGTIGMLFDEDAKLMKFKSVMTVLDNLNDHERFAYSETDGGPKFREAIMRWAFQDQYDVLTKDMFCDAVGTPGGSGAVGSTIANYLNPGDSLLTSNIGWNPYELMAKENFCKVEHYNLFNEKDEYNIDGYLEKADALIKKQGRLLSIINDPCHNPTGFALSVEDWRKIIAQANNSGVPYCILLDMAYIDYLPAGILASRQILTEFLNIKENVIVILALSGSKTFSVYGMRLGAQICIAKTEEAKTAFFKSNEFSARARWSNINHAGIALVERIMNNKQIRDDFANEVKQASLMLTERSKIFIEEAKEIGLYHYPYKGGFFITVPCKGQVVFDKLKENDVFVVPLKIGVRISLSALPKKDIVGLAKKIKDVL